MKLMKINDYYFIFCYIFLYKYQTMNFILLHILNKYYYKHNKYFILYKNKFILIL